MSSEINRSIHRKCCLGQEWKDTGYFRRDERFWTSQDFPEARTIHDRIEARLKTIGTSDPSMRSAYEILQALD
jgi:hypothetical protein